MAITDFWKVEISNTPGSPYEWEGVLGDTMSFSTNINIVEIPQKADPITGLRPINTFDKPYITNITVTTGLGVSYYNIVYGTPNQNNRVYNGSVNIPPLDTTVLFPYSDITYFKNNSSYSVTYPSELYEPSGAKKYDFVTSFVPSRLRSITYPFTVSVYTNTLPVKAATYTFFVENSWTRAMNYMDVLMVDTKNYFESQAEPTLPLTPITVPVITVDDVPTDTVKAPPPVPPKLKPDTTDSITELSLDDEIKATINNNGNIETPDIDIDGITEGDGLVIDDVNEGSNDLSINPINDNGEFSLDKLLKDSKNKNKNSKEWMDNNQEILNDNNICCDCEIED